jgi:hypothetical protein
MLAHQQSQSRWAAFIERWDGRLERLGQMLDPFDRSSDRRMKPWAIVLLAIGLVVLAGLIAFGGWWIVDHRKWGLIYPMLKAMKLLGIGIAILAAGVYALTKSPLFKRFQSRDAAGPKE